MDMDSDTADDSDDDEFTTSAAGVDTKRAKKLSSEFVELYELGRGAFGRVVKAVHVPTLHPVALKKIRCTPDKVASVGQEIEALSLNYVPLDRLIDSYVKSLCLVPKFHNGKFFLTGLLFIVVLYLL